MVFVQVGIVWTYAFAGVASFCPAGFDDDSGSDSGTGLAPDDQRWQCARGQDPDGSVLFDADCVNEIEMDLVGTNPEFGMKKAPIFGGQEDGQVCDWYWGNDEGDDGYWDRLTGEHGTAYWNCYASGKTDILAQWGPEAIEKWSEDRWQQVRMAIDKQCVSPELCAIEHSAKGWCSDFFLEKVQLDCGAEDGYRTKYCTQVCPRQEPGGDRSGHGRTAPQMHPDFFADLDDDGDEELQQPVFPPPRASKCPVKRAAVAIKDKAKEIGDAAWKMLKSFMPALLAPPEPVSSSDGGSKVVNNAGASPAVASPVLPTPVSMR